MNTKNYKLLVAAIAALGFSNIGHATSQGVYDFTGQPGNQVSTPWTGGGSGDVGFSAITRGPGLFAALGTNSMYSGGWTTSPFSPDLADYYEVTMSVRPGYSLSLDRVYFRYANSVLGPQQMVVRSSMDGYTTNIGMAMLSQGVTSDMEIDLWGPVIEYGTLRFYAYNSLGLSGTLRLQNHSTMGGMVFDGTISKIPLFVQWSASSQIVQENIGSMNVWANLSTYSMEDVTVPFTVTGGTAANPDDYTITAGSITIPAGYLSGGTTITVVDDALAENNETVVLTMGTPSSGTLGATTVHTATIADNDGLVQWTASSQSGAEGVGTMTVTAQLSAACGLAVIVPFTVTGTASNPADYSITASPITIPAGSLTGSATITVVNDTLYENNETVVLTMGTPTNAKLGATIVHNATITNDDNTPMQAWRQTHFGSPDNSGDGADLNDFDKDGLLNIVEFAFGLHPQQNSAGMLPQPQRSGDNFVISFTEPAGVSGITYGAEWSQTLGDWEDVPDTGISPQHTFSVPIDTNTQLYMRLKVTGP
jgi:hypothetical protein